jgi:hypothetical protein
MIDKRLTQVIDTLIKARDFVEPLTYPANYTKRGYPIPRSDVLRAMKVTPTSSDRLFGQLITALAFLQGME